MSDEHALPEGEAPRWLDHAENRTLVYWSVIAAYVVFLLLGFAPYERHPYFAFEAFPFFQGLYGLICCVGLVLAARWMRTFLMRDEDYYERD